MNSYNYYQKIICVGDESKYLFIKDMIPLNIRNEVTNEEFHNNDIFLVYHQDNHVEKNSDENFIIISLNVIPIAKIIHIPLNDYEINNEHEYIDKLLMFNLFPFGKQCLIEVLEELLRKFEIGDVAVILYREKRRFGTTDLSSEEEAIGITKHNYGKRSIKTIVYNPEIFDEEIFEVKPNFIRIFKDSYKTRFDNAKSRFYGRFEKEYESNIKECFKFLKIVYPEEYENFDKIFSFDSVSNSDDIWKTFMLNFKKYYIDGDYGILNIIEKLYSKFIDDICIWNKKEDLLKLNIAILNLYYEHFGREKILKMPESELEYIELMNIKEDNSLKVIFKKKLNLFADSKLRILVHKYIEMHLDCIMLGLEES